MEREEPWTDDADSLERARASLAAEARRVSSDPADRAEVQAILAEMESISPTLPD